MGARAISLRIGPPANERGPRQMDLRLDYKAPGTRFIVGYPYNGATLLDI